jgi:EpsI family protein
MRVSIVLALGASVYLLLGKNFTRALLFPLLYLSTMIPLPYVVMKELMYRLRVFDAALSELVLKLAGIPVYRDSYFLHLPNITLEVADACSGTASLFALCSLALVYSYFLPVSWRAKFLLSASAVPFAIFANLLRIITTAALTYYIGPIVLDSWFHSLAGTFNFAIIVTLLVLTGEFLRKRWSIYAEHQTQHRDESEPNASSAGALDRWSSFILGVLIFGIALWYSGNVKTAPGSPLPLKLETVASSLAPAYSVANTPWEDPYEDAKAETSLARIYIGPAQAPIELFIAYRGIQHGRDRLQSPKLIFPKDWNFEWVKPTQIETNGVAKINANWMLTRKASSQRLVLYWYQNRELSWSGELDYRIDLFKNQILGGRTDGAVVRIATSLSDGENVERAQTRLKSFAVDLHPALLELFRQ